MNLYYASNSLTYTLLLIIENVINQFRTEHDLNLASSIQFKHKIMLARALVYLKNEGITY